MSDQGLSREELWNVVVAAEHYDDTVHIDKSSFPAMLERYIAPMRFSRETLFRHMLAGEACLLTGFPQAGAG